MRSPVIVLMLFLWVGIVGAGAAVEPDEILADPVLEARARALSAELRCMVCQNQSIDDSNAPLARDLRILLRERIVAGDSDGEVADFLVARYGEFILLKPRFSWQTAVLWIAAPATLIVGGIIALFLFRRQRQRAEAEPLGEAERRRLATILGPDREP
jgi:cytochrome c-type biogenesis protein CcmH